MSGTLLSLFWLSAALLTYAYIGYPLLLVVAGRQRRTMPSGPLPSVDLLIAAYNEDGCIAGKLENSLELDYPRDLLSITVVTDGSTDGTAAIVETYQAQGVRLLHQPDRQGKAAALARALSHLGGEAVLFSDANCTLAPDTILRMVRHLADPRVGAVSGAKRLMHAGGKLGGEGLYWRYESALKQLDDRLGSVMGAPGEVWLARREAYRSPPEDIILDDFYASMDIVSRGWRVAYEPSALSYEAPSPTLSAEWGRRVRNAAGGWQAVARLKSIWRAGTRAVFQYVSHRVLRWTVVPPLFFALPLFTLALLPRPFYTAVFGLQALFGAGAAAGWALERSGRDAGLFAGPLHVVMLNAAAIAGGVRYMRGRHSVLWPKVR